MSDDEYLLMRRLQRSGSYEEAMAMMSSPPGVKVTEVVGRFEMLESADPYEPTSMYLRSCPEGDATTLDELLPEAALGKGDSGPKGRFRITVEFTPDE